MAVIPVPDAPKLFKKTTGIWAIVFPTVNARGGRCLGSENLKTTDDATAARAFKQWKRDGRFEQIVAADQKNADAYRERREQEKRNLPAVIEVETLNGGHPRRNGKRPPINLDNARTQLKAISAQLHAIALNVQLLGEQLNAADDH